MLYGYILSDVVDCICIVNALRSEIAWRNANYAQILEYLRDEYELAQRFGSLDFKLKFVEVSLHSTCFYKKILNDFIDTFFKHTYILYHPCTNLNCFLVSSFFGFFFC